MKWHECSSEAELKKLGSFSDVKACIRKDLKEKVLISARSWRDLYERIHLLRSFFSYSDKNEDFEVLKSETNFEDFKSEANKYLFCLTRLDGNNRQKNLGVSGLHYRNKETAKNWKRKISQKIHPDKCHDPRASEAIKILDDMYSEMTR